MRAHYIFAALASLSALPAAASSATVNSDGYRTETVQIDYLDLASSSGQAILDRKLARAVKHVCSGSGSTDLGDFMKERNCRREALARVGAQRDLAVTATIRKQRMALASVGRVAIR